MNAVLNADLNAVLNADLNAVLNADLNAVLNADLNAHCAKVAVSCKSGTDDAALFSTVGHNLAPMACLLSLTGAPGDVTDEVT